MARGVRKTGRIVTPSNDGNRESEDEREEESDEIWGANRTLLQIKGAEWDLLMKRSGVGAKER